MAVREGVPRLCETCKHLVEWYNCGRKPLYKSPVDGEVKYRSCNLERDFFNFWWKCCGPSGKFWEYDEEEKNFRFKQKRKEEKLKQMVEKYKTGDL